MTPTECSQGSGPCLTRTVASSVKVREHEQARADHPDFVASFKSGLGGKAVLNDSSFILGAGNFNFKVVKPSGFEPAG